MAKAAIENMATTKRGNPAQGKATNMPAKKPENETPRETVTRELGTSLRAIRRAEASSEGEQKARIAGFRIGVQRLSLELEETALNG